MKSKGPAEITAGPFVKVSFHVNRYAKHSPNLNIQIGDAECIFLDEVAAWFDFVTHEAGKQAVGISRVTYPSLQQRANVGIECGFPKLLGICLLYTSPSPRD